MIHDDLHAGGSSDSRSSNEIETDIRRTRSRMDATLDELGERLSARHILNSALDWWETRSASARSQGTAGAKVAARTLGRQIKENPMPSLLIGAGVAWLLFKDDEHEHRYVSGYTGTTGPVSHDYIPPAAGFGAGTHTSHESSGPGFAEKMKDKLSSAKDAVTGAAGAVSGAVSSAAGTVSDKMSGIGESASGVGQSVQGTANELRYRARRTMYRGRYATRQFGQSLHQGYDTGVEQVRRGMDEYPLAAGLGFAALGALLGLVLPHTRREDELLGERSEQIIGTVKEQGKDLLERGKAVVEQVAHVALDEAQKQGLTPEAASGALSGLAAKAGEVLHKVKDEAVSAAEEQGLTPDKLKEQVSAASGSQSQMSSDDRARGSVPATSGFPPTGGSMGNSLPVPEGQPNASTSSPVLDPAYGSSKTSSDISGM